MAAFKAYYELVKPGRTIANGMTALAGFLLASGRDVDFWLLLAAVGGISLIVASACAFNNYFDRGIDSEMQRTKGRALVKGDIPAWAAVMYAAVLGAIGFAILGLCTNLPTVIAGIVGIVDYLVFYGISKRRSVYSTLIGSICGATPIAAGYTAVTGRFDTGALLLFLLMMFWQMPHFYAIAIYRRDDYAKAGLPIWSVKKGIPSTKFQIIIFAILFAITTALLSMFGYAGWVYFVVSLGLGLIWVYKGMAGYHAADGNKWARGMFGFSLLVLLGFSAAMALNAWLV